jgi:hypothetical protein
MTIYRTTKVPSVDAKPVSKVKTRKPHLPPSLPALTPPILHHTQESIAHDKQRLYWAQKNASC